MIKAGGQIVHPFLFYEKKEDEINMNTEKLTIIDNENIYGEIRYKLIRTKFQFEENIKKNAITNECAVLVVRKEYDEIIFYAKFYNENIEEAYISKYAYESEKLMNDISFFINLKPPFLDEIYKYYV